MFIVNNQVLSKQELPELWNWYTKKINLIKEGEKKYYVFSAYKNFRYEKDEYGKKRRVRRFKTIPSISTINNNDLGETQTWTYTPSASSIRNENGFLKIINRRPFLISENQIYSAKDDFEIIFFLLYISEALKNKKIFIIDQELENIEKAKESAIASEAQYLIFSPQSAINEDILGTDDVYRQLGLAYGVKDSNNLHLAELKNKLWNNLVNLNKGKRHIRLSYEQFIKDCYNNTDSEMKSTILLAIERDVIHFKNDSWWIRIRGEYDELLCHVPTNEKSNRTDILVNYLINHREYNTIIQEALDNRTKRLLKEGYQEGNEESKKELDRKEMIGILLKQGFKPDEIFKKSKDELRVMIEKNKKPA